MTNVRSSAQKRDETNKIAIKFEYLYISYAEKLKTENDALN